MIAAAADVADRAAAGGRQEGKPVPVADLGSEGAPATSTSIDGETPKCCFFCTKKNTNSGDADDIDPSADAGPPTASSNWCRDDWQRFVLCGCFDDEDKYHRAQDLRKAKQDKRHREEFIARKDAAEKAAEKAPDECSRDALLLLAAAQAQHHAPTTTHETAPAPSVKSSGKGSDAKKKKKTNQRPTRAAKPSDSSTEARERAMGYMRELEKLEAAQVSEGYLQETVGRSPATTVQQPAATLAAGAYRTRDISIQHGSFLPPNIAAQAPHSEFFVIVHTCPNIKFFSSSLAVKNAEGEAMSLGIQKYDQLIAVNGWSMQNVEHGEIVKMLATKKYLPMTLAFRRFVAFSGIGTGNSTWMPVNEQNRNMAQLAYYASQLSATDQIAFANQAAGEALGVDVMAPTLPPMTPFEPLDELPMPPVGEDPTYKVQKLPMPPLGDDQMPRSSPYLATPTTDCTATVLGQASRLGQCAPDAEGLSAPQIPKLNGRSVPTTPAEALTQRPSTNAVAPADLFTTPSPQDSAASSLIALQYKLASAKKDIKKLEAENARLRNAAKASSLPKKSTKKVIDPPANTKANAATCANEKNKSSSMESEEANNNGNELTKEEWAIYEMLDARTDKTCSNDDCGKKAIAIWHDIHKPSTMSMLWNSCHDCQKKDFVVNENGWPDNYPIVAAASDEDAMADDTTTTLPTQAMGTDPNHPDSKRKEARHFKELEEGADANDVTSTDTPTIVDSDTDGVSDASIKGTKKCGEPSFISTCNANNKKDREAEPKYSRKADKPTSSIAVTTKNKVDSESPTSVLQQDLQDIASDAAFNAIDDVIDFDKLTRSQKRLVEAIMEEKDEDQSNHKLEEAISRRSKKLAKSPRAIVAGKPETGNKERSPKWVDSATKQGINYSPKVEGSGTEYNRIFVKQTLLELLRKVHRKVDEYGFFSQPVDPIKDECPNYYDIIDKEKEAMDFGTMEKSIMEGSLNSIDEFETMLGRIAYCSRKHIKRLNGSRIRQEGRKIVSLSAPLIHRSSMLIEKRLQKLEIQPARAAKQEKTGKKVAYKMVGSKAAADIPAEPRYSLGQVIEKDFPGYGTFRGEVTLLPFVGHDYYRVKYKDGDAEDIHADKISEYIVSNPRYQIGQLVEKDFPGYGTFRGEVTLPPFVGHDYYRVKYKDGDSEDIHADKISEYIVSKPRYQIGQLVEKFFIGHGTFKGHITTLPSQGHAFYRVKYEDSDAEDIRADKISDYVVHCRKQRKVTGSTKPSSSGSKGCGLAKEKPKSSKGTQKKKKRGRPREANDVDKAAKRAKMSKGKTPSRARPFHAVT